MKYFLDSAKIDEIREAYETFGIDGVTTNPNHIKLSGKPFFTDAMSERIQLAGKWGITRLNASMVYFTVAALITMSGANDSISSAVVKRCALNVNRKRCGSMS